MANRIKDDSGDRKYWVQTPMLIWALSQDPYDLALWFTIKAVAGEDRECTLSTEDLATLSMMSMGKVSQCRARLIELGLLQGEFRKDPDYPQPVWHLTIPDIWETNVAWAKENSSIKARIEHKSLQRSEVQKKRSAVRSLHQVKDTPKEPSPGEEGVTPGEEGVAPGEEGVAPGEEGVTPGEANKIIYRIDLDQAEISKEKGARSESATARVDAPTPTPPATPKAPLLPNDGYEIPNPPTNGHAKKYAKVTSDYYDARRLVNGYIPEGEGVNAIEVYHEWVAPSARRLSHPNQRDIVKKITDLERWRQAVKAWIQAGHRAEDVGGMLDWYHYPERLPSVKFAKPTNGATKAQEVTFKQWMLNTYHSTFASTIKPESELRDEYRQWRKANGLPPAD